MATHSVFLPGEFHGKINLFIHSFSTYLWKCYVAVTVSGIENLILKKSKVLAILKLSFYRALEKDIKTVNNNSNRNNKQ